MSRRHSESQQPAFCALPLVLLCQISRNSLLEKCTLREISSQYIFTAFLVRSSGETPEIGNINRKHVSAGTQRLSPRTTSPLWGSSCYDTILFVMIVDHVHVTNLWLSTRVLRTVVYTRQAHKHRERQNLRISPTVSYYSTLRILQNYKNIRRFLCVNCLQQSSSQTL